MPLSKWDGRAWARHATTVAGLAASAYFAGLAVNEAYLNRTARAVPATVTDVAVTSDAESRGRPLYRPIVGFVYEIDGRRFESARYSAFERRTSVRQTAERAAAQYAVGEQILAFVPPRHPSDAFLRRETTWPLYWYSLLVLGVAWLVRSVFAAKRPGI